MAEKKYRSIEEITHNGKPLREILEAHRIWVETEGEEGARAGLGGVTLVGVNLRGAELRQAILHGADLSGANLSRANLSSANLSRTKLSSADLSGADLSGTKLPGANLSGADLSGANLNGAYLSWTKLSGANLSGASLYEANLSEADLSEADLSGASMGNTVIIDCDLKSAIGLETVQHKGPSSIGIDTIFKSQGKIPKAFLKGAGVPDIFITYVKSLVENPIEFYSCFISHSHKDQEFCERLYADLQANGVRCWYFPEDATWGKSVWGEIDSSIRIYDKLVVVCSEHSLTSGPVIREIERALQREDQEKKEVLFPIRIDDYLFEKWDHPRKADVIAKVVGDFRGWKDHEQYARNFDKLLRALNRPQPTES